MYKIDIYMRAGMNNEAIEMLRELKSLSPQLNDYQIGLIYYDACDAYEAWRVAKATVEIFAENKR